MNLYLGTFDGVLDAMQTHLPVGQVVSEKGRLRNLRLRARLHDQGVVWRELRKRSDFDDFLAGIDEVNLCLVAGFSYMLPQSLIDRCRDVVNFHPGIIQQCRGPQPIATAILQGHSTFGVTAHRIDSEAIDAGPILAQRQLDIDYGSSFSINYARVKALMVEMATSLLPDYVQENWPQGEPWQADDAAYYPRITVEQMQALVKAPNLSQWR